LEPVFYGYADYNPSVGAPTNMRVYYPSADGSPQCAPFLAGPGHFPLVIFLHGNCSETFHFTKWSHLPKVLARSGFIVAIPDLGENSQSPWDLSNTAYAVINNVITWMRSTWSHSAFVMQPPTLGIVGHSYGALLGGQLAKTIPATAYVSLGGVWGHWSPPVPAPIKTLTLPKLLVWGTNFGETDAMLKEAAWNALPQPKYRLVFTNGEHWDYVPASNTSCAGQADSWGPCDLVYRLTADFTAVFLSKYMPPEQAPAPGAILPDLIPPASTRTNEQKSFESGHLESFGAVSTHAGCKATLTWMTPAHLPGTRSLP